MRNIAAAVLLFCTVVVSATAQPSISSIVNAASQQAGPVSAGEIITIPGSHLGPSAIAVSSPTSPATNLGGTNSTNGTSVVFTAGGQTFEAPILATTAVQITAVVPSNLPAGSAAVTVSYNGSTSASAQVQVASSSFGIFAVSGQGSGAGIITDGNDQIFLPTYASMPGDTAVIWGTGNYSNAPATVWVGNTQVKPTSQQNAPCCLGVQTIRFTVPSGITGCSVPVLVQIGSDFSPNATMALTTNSGRVCEDAAGLPAAVLQVLKSNGSVNIGVVDLSRTTTTSPLPADLGGGTTTTDNGLASFTSVTPTTLAGLTGLFQKPAVGSCIVGTSSVNSSLNVGPILQIPQGLDAGAAINVDGPNGTRQLLPVSALSKGLYTGALSTGTAANTTLYLDPGTYTINNGTGGTDVGAFSTSLNVTQPLAWTNQTTLAGSTIPRTGSVTVNWTGGAPGTWALISGYSGSGSLSGGNISVSVAAFTCLAPVANGTFTVGPNILGQLPASNSLSLAGITISTGALSVGNVASPVSFTAPGLNYGYASWSSLSTALVTYQ